MTEPGRLEHLRQLVRDIAGELDGFESDAELYRALDEGDRRDRAVVRRPRREAIETIVRMRDGESLCLTPGMVTDRAIAEFMLLELPISVPDSFEGARETLLFGLLSQAECVGRRGAGGYLWTVKLGQNGELALWVDARGRVERVSRGVDG